MNKHLEKYCVFAWAARLKPDLWYFRTSDLAARMRYWEKSALKKKQTKIRFFSGPYLFSDYYLCIFVANVIFLPITFFKLSIQVRLSRNVCQVDSNRWAKVFSGLYETGILCLIKEVLRRIRPWWIFASFFIIIIPPYIPLRPTTDVLSECVIVPTREQCEFETSHTPQVCTDFLTIFYFNGKLMAIK